jgi:hypothetical protein
VTPRPPPDALGRFKPDHRETRPGNTGRSSRAFTRYDPLRRRAWLMQCEECLATSTAKTTRRGILVSQGFRVERGRHAGCGGRLRFHDIIENGDAA